MYNNNVTTTTTFKNGKKMSATSSLGNLAQKMIKGAERKIEKLEDTIYSNMGELSHPVICAKHEKLRLEQLICNLWIRHLRRINPEGEDKVLADAKEILQAKADRKGRLMAKLERNHPEYF